MTHDSKDKHVLMDVREIDGKATEVAVFTWPAESAEANELVVPVRELHEWCELHMGFVPREHVLQSQVDEYFQRAILCQYNAPLAEVVADAVRDIKSPPRERYEFVLSYYRTGKVIPIYRKVVEMNPSTERLVVAVKDASGFRWIDRAFVERHVPEDLR